MRMSDERPMTPQQYVQDKAAGSGSSFYYAFLFLPAAAARGDHRLLRLLPRGGRRGRRGGDPAVAATKLQWWRGEVAAPSPASPRTR
jgi:phytoene synthase